MLAELRFTALVSRRYTGLSAPLPALLSSKARWDSGTGVWEAPGASWARGTVQLPWQPGRLASNARRWRMLVIRSVVTTSVWPLEGQRDVLVFGNCFLFTEFGSGQMGER